ncbi:MAG: YkgJ family cysteine cluster protein [Gemmatimonadota bacterium]
MTDQIGSPYPELLRQLDDWFAGAEARNPGVIPCRPGCTACCNGPFDISVADVRLIRGAVGRLDPQVRAGVLDRAGQLARRILELAPEWSEPWDIAAIGDERFDRISEALSEVPCPMLDSSGACVIYEDRPLICRWMGLGMEAEDGRSIENGCPIQEQFPAYAALPNQPFALDPFEMREAACLEDAAAALLEDAAEHGYETTIALAVGFRP